MKKAAAAALILTLLGTGAFFNVRHLDSLTQHLVCQIEASRVLCEAGDALAARESLQNALDDWNQSENYTHIVLRHSEVDAVSEDFYDLCSCLDGGDTDSAPGLYDKLTARLLSITAMEHLTWKSVF